MTINLSTLLGTTFKGSKGDKGDTGDTGASIVTAEISGPDILFTKDDTNTVVLENAMVSLKGDTGEGVPSGGAEGDLIRKTETATEWFTPDYINTGKSVAMAIVFG